MTIDRKLSTTVIVMSAMLMLVIYLLAVRFQVPMSSVFFFGSVAVVVAGLLYQILGIPSSSGFNKVILLEIIVASLVFHFIYQIPTYSLYGSDSYYDLYSLRSIMESGNIGGIREYVQITSFFPMIHILGAEFSLVTSMDYIQVAKWLPSILSTAGIPAIYLLVRHLFKKERAALLAIFLYIVMQHHMLFGSLFVRETVAIVFATSCLYFYVAAKTSETPLVYRSLSLVFLAATILSHHLTSVMLIAILILYWIFTGVFKPGGLFRNSTGERISLSLIIIAMIGTLTFWLTNISDPVQVMRFWVSNILNPETWGIRTILQQETTGFTSLPTLRYYFLIYGSYISYALFGLILLWRALRKEDRHIETWVFMAYLVACGVIGVMSYYLLPPTVGGDRFLTFGWLFAIGPVALAIIDLRHKLIKYFAVLVIVFFAFVNIYTIHPTLWNSRAEGAGGAAGKEDYALAETYAFPEEILGYMTNIMTVYSVQNTMGTDAYFLVDPIEFDSYEWVIINREGLKEEGMYSSYTREAIEKMAMLESERNTAYVRTYESNNLAVLRQR